MILVAYDKIVGVDMGYLVACERETLTERFSHSLIKLNDQNSQFMKATDREAMAYKVYMEICQHLINQGLKFRTTTS